MAGLKRNFFYNAVLSLSSIVTPLIIFPHVSRILGPDGIGKVNFANSFIQYFLIVSSLGIPFYGVREIAKVKDVLNSRTKVFIEIFLVRFYFSLIVVLIYLVIILFVPKFTNDLVFYTWGISVILLGIFDVNWFFSGLEQFKYITIRNVAFQIVQLILCFVLVKAKSDTFTFFLIPIVINLLNTVVNIRHILKFLNVKMFSFNMSLQPHIKPLIYLFAAIFATSVYNLLDTTILGFISGDESVGYYTVASKINKVPLSVVLVLVPVMIPRISFAFKNNDLVEVDKLIKNTLSFVLVIGVPIMIGLYILAPEIVTLLSGRKFLPAVIATRILCPMTLIIGITNNFSTQLLIPMGKDKHLLIAVLCGTFISLTLNFLLIPHFQDIGAAVSNIVAEMVVLFACFYFVRKSMDIEMPVMDFFKNLLVCSPIILFCWLSRQIFQLPLLVLLLGSFLSATYCLFAQAYILKNLLVQSFINTGLNRVGLKKILF